LDHDDDSLKAARLRRALAALVAAGLAVALFLALGGVAKIPLAPRIVAALLCQAAVVGGWLLGRRVDVGSLAMALLAILVLGLVFPLI
jgi:hypothetical protein